MKLVTTSKFPEAKKYEQPLLFIHGAWHGSWCWEKYFIPYFVQKGYECHALNFRGHGGSENNKSLKITKIWDYVDDVRTVIEELKIDPILIAHSMGGLVTQNYLTKYEAPAAVLLAPVPPWGVIRTTLKVALRYPWAFLKANLFWSLYPFVDSESKVRNIFFTEDLDPSLLTEYANQIQDESFFAFMGMLLFALPKTKKVKTQMLVLGGEKDWIFNPKQVTGTAKRYNAQVNIIEKVGHDMMLDPRWEEVAENVQNWLKGVFPSH